MRSLDERSAVTIGGWDPRYAVVLAIAEFPGFALALIDPNGDEADINLDQYRRGPGGGLVETASGNISAGGWSWGPDAVVTCGQAAPGEAVLVEHAGQVHRVVAGENGWWLFAAPRNVSP